MLSFTLGLPAYEPQNDSKDNCLKLFREHDRAVKTSNELGLHLARVDGERQPFRVLKNIIQS